MVYKLDRLTLKILLSFAQLERETISERTRDKQIAARRKGKWTGGHLPLGYDLDPNGGRLVANGDEAVRVRLVQSSSQFGRRAGLARMGSRTQSPISGIR